MSRFSIFFICCLGAVVFSCEKNTVEPVDFYDCSLGFSDSSAKHPKANIYQEILDENRKQSAIGAVLLVKDEHGVWMGASGYADVASNAEMKPCNTFLIASISKVFTSAAVYRLIDDGIMSLNDPISKWLDDEVVEKVENASECQVKHLLSHTSGIADYYTTALELDRLNRESNNWSKEEVLAYTYGKKATNKVGETYYYCNTNFLILAMMLEKASGKSFEEVYQQEVFEPLGLTSAYYSESNPIPAGCVKGYAEIYGNDKYAETEFLYGDELGIGGDGGVAINAYDLAMFLENLAKGNLISDESYAEMTNWFDIPEDWHWDAYGQIQNGYGIEKFDTDFGVAIGHTGGIDGFSTYAYYFPDSDKTYILLQNSIGLDGRASDIFEAIGKEMFN